MQRDNPSSAHEPSPPLAVDELTERCMGSVTVAELILDKFEEQLHADLAEIERRLAEKDAPPVARVAHALKGAAGTAAAPTLRDLAARIELLAKQGDLDAVAGSVETLRAEVDRCLAYFPTARRALCPVEPSSEPDA